MAPQDDTDFESAFNEDATATTAQSEDDAFGITPPAEAEATPAAAPAAGEPEANSDADESAAAAEAKAVADAANEKARPDAGSPSTATAEAGDGGAVVDGSPDEGAAETPAAAAAELGLDDDSDVPEEDKQKFKSWQGRLKKIEAELKAKLAGAGAPATPEAVAAEGADAIEQAADAAAAAGDTELAAAADQAAQSVENGDADFEEAIKALSEDFGEQFVSYIEKAATRAASRLIDERVGAVSKDVEGLIENLTNERERTHFETIYDAHPDFVEVSQDPAFNEFVAAAGKQDVAERGSAKQINALLSEFKASKEVDPGDTPNGERVAEVTPDAAPAAPAQKAVAAAADAVDDDEVDAAEGVRSTGGGLRLPEKPIEDEDDFVAAWNRA